MQRKRGRKNFPSVQRKKIVKSFVWEKNAKRGTIFCRKFVFRNEIWFWNKISVDPAVHLVPTRRLFQFYLDDLFGIADFKPLAVTLPAFGNYLNQDFSKRRVRNVRNPLAIRFDV